MDEAGTLTLRYTPSARSDIRRILDHVGDQSRMTMEAALRGAFDLLVAFPMAGTMTTRTGLRRRVVTPYPYVVFYQVKSSLLVIVAVRHTARRPRFG